MTVTKEFLKEEREQAWRVDIRKLLKNKERTALIRVHMGEVNPNERVLSNIEVNTGLREEEAINEAKRCLDCPDPTCITGLINIH